MWFGVVPCLTHGSFARFYFKEISILQSPQSCEVWFQRDIYWLYFLPIARFYGGVPILPLLSESPQSPLPSIWLETKHGKGKKDLHRLKKVKDNCIDSKKQTKSISFQVLKVVGNNNCFFHFCPQSGISGIEIANKINSSFWQNLPLFPCLPWPPPCSSSFQW